MRISKKYGLFFLSIFLMATLVYIPVGCPTCGSIDTQIANQTQSVFASSLSLEDTRAVLISFKRQHAWCANQYVEVVVNIEVLIRNNNPSEFDGPILIKGQLSEKIRLQFASALGYENKLIYLRIPGEGIAEATVNMRLWAVGLSITEEMIANPEISLIVRPREIVDNCPLCKGTQKIYLPSAIKEYLK